MAVLLDANLCIHLFCHISCSLRSFSKYIHADSSWLNLLLLLLLYFLYFYIFFRIRLFVLDVDVVVIVGLYLHTFITLHIINNFCWSVTNNFLECYWSWVEFCFSGWKERKKREGKKKKRIFVCTYVYRRREIKARKKKNPKTTKVKKAI